MRGSRFRVPLAMAAFLVGAHAPGQPPVPKPTPLAGIPKLETPAVFNLPGTSSDTTTSTQAPARNERALFEAARSYFDEASYGSAVYNLQEFLALYPRSRLAAEAKYRMAVANLLLERKDESGKLFEQLVRDFPKSPWARLALTAHLTQEQLRKLGDERRLRAKEGFDDAMAAVDVYKVLLERAGKDIWKPELAFRIAVCLELAGNRDEANKFYKQVGEGGNDDKWATLARLRTGDATAFQEGMADLVALDADGEEALTFLDLADRFEQVLNGDERLQCETLRGRCLSRLDRGEQAVGVWRKAVAADPESPWAPECLYWLAEHYYRHKELARAAEEYRVLLQKYPGSARAAVVRRWADALPAYDDNWAELEKCLTTLGNKLTAGELTFSAELTYTQSGSELRFSGRVAYQDRSHYVLEAAFLDMEFLLLANDEGGWLRMPGESTVRTTPNRAPFPLPLMKLSFDPFTGKQSFNLAAVSGLKGPLLELSPDYVAALLSESQGNVHVRRLVRTVAGESRVVFVLESPSQDSVDPSSLELEVDAAGMLRTIRSSEVYNGAWHILALSDIHINEPLPQGTFATRLPKGIATRDVDSISIMDFLPELSRLYQVVCKTPEDSNKNYKR